MGYIVSYYFDYNTSKPVFISKRRLEYRNDNEYQILLYYSKTPNLFDIDILAKGLVFLEEEFISKNYEELGIEKPEDIFIGYSCYQIELEDVENISNDNLNRDEIIVNMLEDKLRFEAKRGLGKNTQKYLEKKFN